MAIYIYKIADGTLVSWNPNDTDPVAIPAQLTAQGLASASGLPALSPTVGWDAPTHTTKTIVPPPATRFLSVYSFILRFTPAELQAIRASTDSVVQYFLFVLPLALNQVVDLNDPGLASFMARLVTLALLTQPRSTTIMT